MQKDVCQKLLANGGEYYDTFKSGVTHLIATAACTDKYKASSRPCTTCPIFVARAPPIFIVLLMPDSLFADRRQVGHTRG